VKSGKAFPRGTAVPDFAKAQSGLQLFGSDFQTCISPVSLGISVRTELTLTLRLSRNGDSANIQIITKVRAGRAIRRGRRRASHPAHIRGAVCARYSFPHCRNVKPGIAGRTSSGASDTMSASYAGRIGWK
jgi:hypothetical protein